MSYPLIFVVKAEALSRDSIPFWGKALTSKPSPTSMVALALVVLFTHHVFGIFVFGVLLTDALFLGFFGVSSIVKTPSSFSLSSWKSYIDLVLHGDIKWFTTSLSVTSVLLLLAKKSFVLQKLIQTSRYALTYSKRQATKIKAKSWVVYIPQFKFKNRSTLVNGLNRRYRARLKILI